MENILTKEQQKENEKDFFNSKVQNLKQAAEVWSYLSRIEKKCMKYLHSYNIRYHLTYLSQQNIADHLGIRRESANRLLKRLEEKGLILKFYRHRLTCFYELPSFLRVKDLFQALRNGARRVVEIAKQVGQKVKKITQNVTQNVTPFNRYIDIYKVFIRGLCFQIPSRVKELHQTEDVPIEILKTLACFDDHILRQVEKSMLKLGNRCRDRWAYWKMGSINACKERGIKPNWQIRHWWKPENF